MRSERDAVAIRELLQVHKEHPRYGVRRLAAELGWSENKARRIRRLAGVTIARRGRKYGKRVRPEIQAPANALNRYAVFRDDARPQAGMDYRNMVNSGALHLPVGRPAVSLPSGCTRSQNPTSARLEAGFRPYQQSHLHRTTRCPEQARCACHSPQ